MNKKKLGFIGGSGLYEIDFIKNKKFINKKSSWGNPSSKVIQGTLSGNESYCCLYGQNQKKKEKF